MFISIKHKLAVLTSILIIVSVGLCGYFLIDQKSKELKEDIWRNGLHFAELATKPLSDSYELHFKSQSTFYFERDLKNIFELSLDVSQIKFASFSGEILTNYSRDIKPISGEILDENMFAVVQDIKPAIVTDKRIIFVKKDLDGGNIYVDSQENPTELVRNDEYVSAIVYPSDDNKTRIIYSISYEHLHERVARCIKSLMFMLLGVAFLGVVVAWIFAKKLVVPILSLTKGAKQIATGDFKVRVNVKTHDETKILSDTFNQMAGDLEKSIKIKLENERFSKELEIATHIQLRQIPQQIPKLDGLEIANSTSPASEVGGDCYDFIKVDDNNYFFYIGDATGHGIPASLVVALSSASLFGAANNLKDPKAITDSANITVSAKTQSNMFFTCVGCNWNVKTKEMTYVQAGHDPILLYRSKTKKVELLSPGGMALGMMPDLTALTKKEQIKWDSGDILLLYTDGIPEAYKNKKDQLGMEEFKKIAVKHCSSGDVQKIHDNILKDVRSYMGKWPQNDDITLIIVKKV